MASQCFDDSFATRLARGAVDRAEAAEARAHAAGCAPCRGRLEAAQQAHEDRADAPTVRRSDRPDATTASAAPPASAPADLRAGALVGRYLLLAALGEGGMGQVWSAYDPKLERKVAIKLLRPGDGGAGPEAQARLLAEAQAMAKLSHPNVLPIYDVGVFEGQVFLAMELADSGDLKRWLRDAPRSTGEIVEAFLAAGEGLSAAHAAGLIHRDFKPANVLIARDGAVRVGDFGVASTESLAGRSSGKPGSYVGTLGFAAPELMDGGAATQASDQFSFCVSLWQGLFGAKPYPGSTPEEFLASVRKGPAAPAAGRRVQRRLLRALERGLSPEPSARFPSLAALLLEISRDPWRRLKRRAVPAASLALALGVATVAGAWYLRQATRCGREAEAAVAAVWSPERRAAVARSFAEAGQPAAEARLVQETLDRYFAKWRTVQAAACEEARSKPANAHALGCLRRRLARGAALASILGRGGADLSNALSATVDSSLGPESCDRVRTRPAPAEDADLAALRASTMECDILVDLGRVAEVEARLPALEAEARRLGALEELADLAADRAQVRWMAAGTQGLLPLLQEAVRAADASGIDELGVSSRLSLAEYYLLATGMPDQAEAALSDAEVWLERAGRPPAYAAALLALRSDLAAERGLDEEALRLARQHRDESERLYGAGAAATAHAWLRLGSTLVRARLLAESVTAISKATELLDAAPAATREDRALAHANLAAALLDLGRLDEAAAALAQAESLGTAASAPDKAWHAMLRGLIAELGGRAEAAEAAFEQARKGLESLDLANRSELLAGSARVLLRQGKIQEALEAAREADGLVTGSPERSARAGCRFTLAEALWAAGERDAALAAAREAEKLYAAPEDGFGRGRVQAWMAAHPPRP